MAAGFCSRLGGAAITAAAPALAASFAHPIATSVA